MMMTMMMTGGRAMTGTTMMFRTNYATVASFARNGARMFWQHVTSGVTIAGKHART